jgi:HK97 family phage major capsid protein
MSYLQRLVDAQNRDLHSARSFVERAESEKREMSVEERTAWDAINAEMDKRQAHIAEVRADDARTADIEASVAFAPEVRVSVPERRESDSDIVRKLIAGDIRSYNFERRDLNTTDDSAVVPQSFYDVIQESLVTVGPMLDGGIVTLLNTASGEDIKVPVESTRPAATAIAEGTTITELDPTFSNITLKAQKVAVLTKISRELMTDSGIDIMGYLGRTLGTSIGIRVNNLLTVGTGTTIPNGVVTAAGSGVVGGTAVSGAFTADNLIDLAHSVDGAYVRQGASFMMRRTSIGAVRKLKDTAGNYLFVPAATVGSPDTLLGFPIVENPDVAATATSAKSVLFGWFGSYHVRQVGGIEVARSEDAYFASDEIGVRLTMRVWGDLGQSAAVKYFIGNAA